MLNLNSIMLGSENPKKLADFYGQVLNKKPDMEEAGYIGYLAGNCFLSIGAHDKVKGQNQNPERIIYFFETSDVKGEFERISNIDGAQTIAKPYQPAGEHSKYWLATFADPDGNYFQLASPWDTDNSDRSE